MFPVYNVGDRVRVLPAHPDMVYHHCKGRILEISADGRRYLIMCEQRSTPVWVMDTHLRKL